MGYSFGADVVPFIAPQLPPELRKKLLGVVCLSPDENASFEIRLGDMLELSSTGTYKVLPAVQRISAFNPVCVFGSQEDAALPKKFAGAGAKIVVLPGNHHFNENYDAIAACVLENYRKK
jgi:type IV secretory pathway VirJ component